VNLSLLSSVYRYDLRSFIYSF